MPRVFPLIILLLLTEYAIDISFVQLYFMAVELSVFIFTMLFFAYFDNGVGYFRKI